MSSNVGVDRHTVAWRPEARTITSTLRGAMPPRVRVERPVQRHATGSIYELHALRRASTFPYPEPEHP